MIVALIGLFFVVFFNGVVHLAAMSAEDSRRFQYWLGNHERRIRLRINKQHPFYLSLTPVQQREFLWRIFYFLKSTHFVIKFPGDSTKVKMTISFVAAQISHALSIRSFDQYHRVIIYEDDYYSQINDRYHKGEINPGAGIMVFSWNSIQNGLSRDNDGLNLLVHEFAHALRLEQVMMGNHYTIFDEQAFDAFDKLAHKELEHMRTHDEHFFRRYAMTNIDEFFAVGSENFFERAPEFSLRMPKLYAAFKKLYNQDPLA